MNQEILESFPNFENGIKMYKIIRFTKK